MFSMINKIRKLFLPEDKIRLLLVTFGMSIAALGEMLGIGLLIGVITIFLQPELINKTPWLKNIYLWSGLLYNHFVVISIVIVGACLLLKNLFSLFIVHVQSKFIYNKQSELIQRMFSSFLYAPYKQALEQPLALRNVFLTRAMGVSNNILLPFMQLLSDFMLIMLLGIATICMIPLVAICSIIFMAMTGYLCYFTLRSANTRMGKLHENALTQYEEIKLSGLSGIKAVKILGKEEFFTKNFKNVLKQVSHTFQRLYTMGQVPRLFLESCALVLLLGLFVILLSLGKSSSEILLTFTLIVAVMSRILPALSRCNYNLTVIRQGQYLFDSVSDKLLTQMTEDMGSSTVIPTLNKELEIKNLSFGYDEKNIINNFSIKLPAYQTLGISGKTGCGKTTLVDLILGLLRPNSGTITSDGQDIFSNLSSWRKSVGYVPQNVYIRNGTIRENVAFGCESSDIDDQKVEEVLQLAQIGDWVKNTPDGIYHILQENGANLSGGQRQRIGIARALYTNPKLLILDEATSALDNETEKAFVEALETLNGKLTMIVIAHRLSTIEKCNIRYTF